MKAPRLNWPHWAIIALLGFAAGAGAGTYYIKQSQAKVVREVRYLNDQIHATTGAGDQTKVDAPWVMPLESQYQSDLSDLFRIAKADAINFGPIDYKYDRSTQINSAVYSLEIRLTDEYPKVKKFVSDVLSQMANSTLQEIRIERKDTTASIGSMVLKIGLVYQLEAGAAQ